MHYDRRYIQYNDLVFDEVGYVESGDYSTSFKRASSEYTFRHGEYVPLKADYGLLRASGVSLTMTMRMQKLPCEHRPFYVRFVKSELMRPGKLWAVQDNTLIWAYARVTNFTTGTNAVKDTYEVNIDFELWEGYWHKADKLKTFLVPHDVCDFMDCYDFSEYDPCGLSPDDCCNCSKTEPVEQCDCCDGNGCDQYGEENALCYFKDLSEMYDCDGPHYKVIYDCEAAEKIFGDPLSNTPIGQKFCDPCGNLIAGQIISRTDIPTDGLMIRIHGVMHNPYIEINGNGNIIQGDYEGTLDIYPNGEMYAYKDDCGPCDPLPESKRIIPAGMKLGWTIYPGKNKFVVDGGTCCALCVYFVIDELAI